MNLFSNFFTVLPGLGVMFFLVFIHECGHLMCLRWFRVFVERFSVGFGKPFFRIRDGKGMEWTVAPFLMGGFVKFPYNTSDVTAEMQKPASLKVFNAIPPWQRASVLLGGPSVNILFSWMVCLALPFVFGVPEPRVVEVSKGSSFMAGDRITHLDDKQLGSSDWLFTSAKKVSVERCGQSLDITLPTKCALRDVALSWSKSRAGMCPSISYGWGAFVHECRRMWGAILLLVEGNISKLRGIPTIFKSTKDKWQVGGEVFFSFMAALSLSLGFLNLLPVPGLDGGHLLLLGFSVVFNKGKPLPVKLEKIVTYVSFGLLLALMCYVNVKDLISFLV